MNTITYNQLRQIVNEAHGDKNNSGWRKNQRPGSRKERLHEEDSEEELEDADTTEEDDDENEVKIVTFKTTDKHLINILQSDTGINGITISTADDVQTFGPESFGHIEVNDWSEDDVEDDEDDSVEVSESTEISEDESETIRNACERLAAENPRRNIDLIDKRITYDGEFDNGHVIHNDWKEISAFDAELWAKEKSLENPDKEYWVKYDDIMIGSSDLQWKNGKIV